MNLLCGIVFCFAVLAAPAWGRTVSGIVTDGQGKPIEKAAVRLKNPVTLAVRSVVSGAGGVYRITGLDPRMDYEVRATYGEASSGWVRLSRFDEGDERTINLTVK